ncbi:coiled-coil domain-containing protein 81-like [Amphiura filiformis]|uniref:coiled-coil domain-containing protein 81-like n=1 Tax=Amphiura filiformis TaxID=82378 RepID=UPI003B224969
MADVCQQELVSNAKRHRFSTIPKLTDEDVVSVWDNVASFVERHMSMQKGVHIAGLGTFTFTQKKLDVGNNKFILMQRPVFVLSEKFAQTHGLNYTKHFTSGQIPIVDLNFSTLSTESPFDRDTVEGCVKEVLQALARSVQSKRNVEFTFTGIGRLAIRDNKVKMKFYKDFLNMMDGSGVLAEALRNRADTADSVLSRASTCRPFTGNTLVLPRITQGAGKEGFAFESDNNNKSQAMPSIEEDIHPPEEPNEPAQEATEFNDQMDGVEEEQDVHLEDLEYANEEPIRKPPSRTSSRQVIHTPKAVGISLTDDLVQKSPSPPRGIRGNGMAPSPPNGKPSPLRGEFQPPRSLPPMTPEEKRVRLMEEALVRSRSMTPPASACSHDDGGRAGQELCYLCHQRASRNIPVSFEAERRRKEQEQDRLMQQYQHMKDTEAIIKEQAQNFSNRHHNQKIAAFNLGVSEAIKGKKKERSTDFHRSYVFQNRPLTPPRHIKQEEYSDQLGDQVEAKTTDKVKRTRDNEFLERLEQVQLAEELAAQREQYLRDKALHTESYQRALSAQVRFKPLPLPAAVSDSSEPIFGKYDASNEQLAEKRPCYRSFKEQLAAVENARKDKLLQHLRQQQEESSILDKTRRELIADRAARYEDHFGNRKSLEDDWQRAASLKRIREKDYELRSQTPGVLLHEQCDKYNRCGQCQRRKANGGESNIWSETRYIPGSRLMV